MEDFSGRGLDDLRAGVVRTPLAPRETFMDGGQADDLHLPVLAVFLLRYGLHSWPMHHIRMRSVLFLPGSLAVVWF